MVYTIAVCKIMVQGGGVTNNRIATLCNYRIVGVNNGRMIIDPT